MNKYVRYLFRIRNTKAIIAGSLLSVKRNLARCCKRRVGLAGAHGDAGFAVLGALFDGLAFVVLLFALPDSDTKFDKTAAGQDFERYNGAALRFCFDEGVDFAPFGQQFTGAGLLRLVDRNSRGAVDGAIEQEQFAVFDGNIRAAQLPVPQPQRLGFGTGERQTHDKAVAQLVVKPCPPVLYELALRD